jgi:diadenylate cyclase
LPLAVQMFQDIAQRIEALLDRLRAYPPWEVAVELLLIGLVVYTVVRFVRGTRAAGALKGLFVVLILATVLARVIGASEAFQRLAFLYDRFLAIVAVGLLVIFQPELRRGLIRLGEATFWRGNASEIMQTVDAIVEACQYFSRSRFGAIIVIQRSIGLKGLVEGGTPIGAELSGRLLQTLFFPGTALHDLAVVVKGNILHSAGVQLPLAEPSDMPDPRLGSRHRAAVGLTKECDALVVVVSEETGEIRIAERGRLIGPMDVPSLREELLRRLRLQPPPSHNQTAEEQVESETQALSGEPASHAEDPLRRARDQESAA